MVTDWLEPNSFLLPRQPFWVRINLVLNPTIVDVVQVCETEVFSAVYSSLMSTQRLSWREPLQELPRKIQVAPQHFQVFYR